MRHPRGLSKAYIRDVAAVFRGSPVEAVDCFARAQKEEIVASVAIRPEHVTQATDRLDVAGVTRVGLDLLANAVDPDVD